MDDSLKLPGNIVASLRHQRAKVYMKGRIFPEKGNKKQANKGVACAQKSPAILICTGGLSNLWKENRWSVNKLRRKGRRGGGLIPHSRFLFSIIPHSELLLDLLTSRAFERVARLWARSASERKFVPGPTTPDQKTKRTTLRKSKLLSSLLRIPFSYLIPDPEILANPVSRQDILRLLDSHTTQIPRIPLQTMYVTEEGLVRRPKGTWFLSMGFRSLTVSCIVRIILLRALLSN